MDVLVDFEPMCPGFESRESHDFFFMIFLFIYFLCFLSLLLQCKFANSTLLSLPSFSYFITPYDAQASSAFSAFIFYYYPQWPLAHEAAFSNYGGILFCLLFGDNQVQYRYCVCSVSNIICLTIHTLTKYKWLDLRRLQLNLEFA